MGSLRAPAGSQRHLLRPLRRPAVLLTAAGLLSGCVGSNSPTPSPSPQTALSATTVTTSWPDETWNIWTQGADACSGSGPSETNYATDPRHFTCGFSSDGLKVCLQTGQTVTCIVDYATRSAVQFQHLAPVGTFAVKREYALPLQVTIEGGETCVPVAHDHARHYKDGRNGLYRTQGGYLLLDADGYYFDTSKDVWTAQYGFATRPPEGVQVVSVVVPAAPPR